MSAKQQLKNEAKQRMSSPTMLATQRLGNRTRPLSPTGSDTSSVAHSVSRRSISLIGSAEEAELFDQMSQSTSVRLKKKKKDKLRAVSSPVDDLMRGEFIKSAEGAISQASAAIALAVRSFSPTNQSVEADDEVSDMEEVTQNRSEDLDLKHNDNSFHVLANLLVDFFHSKIACKAGSSSSKTNTLTLQPEDRLVVERLLPESARKRFIEAVQYRLKRTPAAATSPLQFLTLQCQELGLDKDNKENPILAALAMKPGSEPVVVPVLTVLDDASTGSRGSSKNVAYSTNAESDKDMGLSIGSCPDPDEKDPLEQQRSKLETEEEGEKPQKRDLPPKPDPHALSASQSAHNPKQEPEGEIRKTVGATPSVSARLGATPSKSSLLGVAHQKAPINKQLVEKPSSFFSPGNSVPSTPAVSSFPKAGALASDQANAATLQQSTAGGGNTSAATGKDNLLIDTSNSVFYDAAVVSVQPPSAAAPTSPTRGFPPKPENRLGNFSPPTTTANGATAGQQSGNLPSSQDTKIAALGQDMKNQEFDRRVLRSGHNVSPLDMSVDGHVEADSLVRQQLLAELKEATTLMNESLNPETAKFWRDHVNDLQTRLRALQGDKKADIALTTDTPAAQRSIAEYEPQYKPQEPQQYKPPTPMPPTASDIEHPPPTSQVQLEGFPVQQHSHMPHTMEDSGYEPPMVDVIAPADLPGGYHFEAEIEGQRFLATVPPGGVQQGETFTCYMRELDSVAIDIPVGYWKDNLSDVCRYGWFHPVVWNSCFFPLVTLGQIQTRIGLDFLGRPTTKEGGTTNRSMMLTIIAFWVVLNLCLFGGYNLKWSRGFELSVADVLALVFLNVIMYLFVVFITQSTRNSVREKFLIREERCHDLEDLCCSTFCLPCTVCQLARHTANYDDYEAVCCAKTGLPDGVRVNESLLSKDSGGYVV